MEYTNKPLDKWRSRYPIWIQMLVVLSILLPIVLIHNHYFYQVLPKLASSYLDALHNGEYSRAYYAYTTENFKKKTDLIQFKDFIKRHPLSSSSFQVERLEPLNGVLDLSLADQIVAFRFQRSNFSWKIAEIDVDGDYLPADDNKVGGVIEAQLSLIQNDEIAEAYYTYMSGDFRERNSLGSFQEMVEFFTPLKNKLEWVKSEHGVAKVSLGGTVGEYTLCKESGSWKISSFDFTNREPQDPKEIVQSQLVAIRSREIAKAYFEFTSKEFQNSISLQEFKAFLKKQEPFLHHLSPQIQSVKQAKAKATVIAALCSIDHEPFPVEFDLVLEREVWRINQIVLN